MKPNHFFSDEAFKEVLEEIDLRSLILLQCASRNRRCLLRLVNLKNYSYY